MRAADRTEWGGEDWESAEEENEITYFVLQNPNVQSVRTPAKKYLFSKMVQHVLCGGRGVVVLSGLWWHFRVVMDVFD